MVDFKKRLAVPELAIPVNPVEIYDTLDRASDKGALRTAQKNILQQWFRTRRDERDVIIKLHTGQGKTLIGLLILLSKLNEQKKPALYLCPNNFLVNQTCEQARQFGINFCTVKDDLPLEFMEGKSILITSVQKLFNGLTKFHLGKSSEYVSSIVMDDAHACIDAIKDALRLKLPMEHSAYIEIRNLFNTSLQDQGAGTFADIKNNQFDVFSLVPYWEWQSKQEEVVSILSRFTKQENGPVKFAWPLLKDNLINCQCVISGTYLEIAPYLPPLQIFGSYYKAEHRVFMSATVTNDAFLVKGLDLAPATVKHPLIHEGEKWSGEKMILVPSLIDDALDRSAIVERFGKPKDRSFGVVALAPSFNGTRDWEKYDAVVAGKDSNLRL